MLRKSLMAMLVTALITSAASANSNRATDVRLLDNVKASAELDLTAALLGDAGEIDVDVLPVIGSEEKPADAEELGWRHRSHGYRHYGYRHYGYGYGYRNYGYRHYGHYNYYPSYYNDYNPYAYSYGCWW